MGNYIFRTAALLDELRRDAGTEATTHDFGRDVLTSAHKRMRMLAYDFASQLCPGESERSRGYWRDVGTIDAFFEANLDLVSVEPRLNLYNDLWPIRGNQPPSGPCKFVFADEAEGRVGKAVDSIVGAGTIVSGGTHRAHRLLLPRAREQLQPGLGERAVPAGRRRARREAAPLHRRQGRAHPGGRGDRLRPRGAIASASRCRRAAWSWSRARTSASATSSTSRWPHARLLRDERARAAGAERGARRRRARASRARSRRADTRWRRCCPAYRSALAHPSCPAARRGGRGAPARPVRRAARALARRAALAPAARAAAARRARRSSIGRACTARRAQLRRRGARFIAFSRAVALRAHEERPDVLVAHDWHARARAVRAAHASTTAAPRAASARCRSYTTMRTRDARPPSAMSWTALPRELFAPDGLEFFGDLVAAEGAGSSAADRIVAVSPSYAREMQTPEFGDRARGRLPAARARACSASRTASTWTASTRAPTRRCPSASTRARSRGKRACRERAARGARARDARAGPLPGRRSDGSARRRAGTCWSTPLPALVASGASLALLGDGERAIADALARRGVALPAARARDRWPGTSARRAGSTPAPTACSCRRASSRAGSCSSPRSATARCRSRTASGGLADTIRDGETGILFAPLSAETLVAAATRAAKLVRRARPRADACASCCSLDVSWARPAALWEATLEERRARGAGAD